MKKLFFSTSLITLFIVNTVSAQYEVYPAFFGRQAFSGGTARYLSIGGAATSLGADLGSAGVNPAGLGMYRKSEFSFTPNIGIGSSTTSFLGQTQRANSSSYSLSNLGIAFCGAKDDLDKSDWRGGTFSITMNRTNNFHSKVGFNGVDADSSIATYFKQQANGTAEADLQSQDPTDPSGTGIYSLAALAYFTSVINATPANSNSSQYTNYLDGNPNVNYAKSGLYTTKGAQYTWNFAYGANYKDKLYIGGALGINTINFRETLNYTENVNYLDYNATSFNSITFDDYNKIKGTGVNFKLGYIYKVSDVVKIGTTVTTPTYYWMTQTYSSDLSAVFPTGVFADRYGNPLDSRSQNTVSSDFRFNYMTPPKIAAGMSLFAGKSGFISGDLEFIPYQLSLYSSKSNSDNTFLQYYNNVITNSYSNVLNLRIGGELRLDIFRLRAGLGYLPNPYKYSDGVNRNLEQISFGGGVKLENIYFDLGFVNSRYQSSYQPYTLISGPSPTSISNNSFVNAVFTMGFYFE